MKVDTRDFEATHGRKPRGRGQWVFRAKRVLNVVTIRRGVVGSEDQIVRETKVIDGTYGEARRRFLAWARKADAADLRLEA